MSTAQRKRTPRTRGPARTERDDWLRAALDLLISDGVDAIKIAALSERLGCARSSFYWYFKNRDALLDALLDKWQSLNTRTIVANSAMPAQSINMGLINLFHGMLNPKKFDTRLDFAVREWSRRNDSVRRVVDISDTARLDSIAGLFVRFGYDPAEAAIRARIVYYSQIGYEALDRRETRLDRKETGPHYLLCLTGVTPNAAECAAISQLAMEIEEALRTD